jgi:predicted AlkP superfamily pyrophosphatase or phosphodiesterase
VSFSSHDYLGHRFGPNSREMEEMTVDEDKRISQILNHVKKSLPNGLKDVVVVMTADHGVAPNADWAKAKKIDAGRINEEKIGEELSAYLNEAFGKPNQGNWVELSYDFNIYLNLAAIEAKKLDLAQVEAKAKSFLEKVPGAAFIVSSTDIKARRLPPGILERQLLKSFYFGRNGNLMIIPKPFFTPADDPVIHITGYSYDRTVPIILVGRSIKPGVYPNRAEVVDIAPTLSFLTGVIPPALSEGRVLSEAIAVGK